MTEEVFESVLAFLESCSLKKTARVLRAELKATSNIVLEKDKERSLLQLVNTQLARKQSEAGGVVPTASPQQGTLVRTTGGKLNGRKKSRRNLNPLSNDQVESIMENFMNKLFASPNLLEDERLNFKIERIFENKLFQKMVENANVLEDAGLGSEDGDKSGEFFDPKKDILNLKAIEKSELIAPYEPPEEKSLTENTKKEDRNLKKAKEFTSKKKKEKKKDDNDESLEMENVEKRMREESERFENHVNQDMADMSEIDATNSGDSKSQVRSILTESSTVLELMDINEDTDNYENDDDPGFDLYQVNEFEFPKISKHLAKEYNFPENAVKAGQKKKKRQHKMTEDQITAQANKKNGYIFLPETLKHPTNEDSFYPVGHDKIVYDCFDLKVIYDRERTGFEDSKEFPIVLGSIIAGRYQIMEYLGSAAFSKAIQCMDLRTGYHYCMKVIENNKDYFDQSIDEIKLLRFINCNGNVDDHCVLRVFDYFYHKEHLFIVTELLKDNLYEYYKFNKEQEEVEYFTIGRLQKVTWQILQGLQYIHGLNLIHCDLKPENIMIKSYSKTQVKIIDFGSSCYTHDQLSSYVQSRSYRAPEVIIGCKYDSKIDLWSLGCILAELHTGSVLFQSDTIQGVLARFIGIIGPFPEWMFEEGKLVYKFFTKEKILYQEVAKDYRGLC